MSSRYIILFVLILLVFTSFGLAQVAPELFVEADESSLNSLQAAYLATIKNRQTTVMYRVVRIPVLNALQNFPIIELNLFPNKSAQATQQFVERRSETDFTWTGGIEDRMGSVILVVNSIGVTGSIRFDGELFKVESLGGDYHVITKIDRGKSPPEHPDSHNDNGAANALSKAIDALDTTMSLQSTAVIDLLVVYTASVASNYPNISGLIQFDENETNLSYQHCSVNARVNVVHYEEVNYIEFGGYSEHLDWFMYSSTINALRDQYSADVCVLLVNDTSSCGLAADIPASESTAYCVVHYDNAVCDLSFPHEIGHLQGGRHHFEDDRTPGPHHGYNDPFGVYRTVMTTFLDNPWPTCVREDYWSNPNVYWNNDPNQPMGTINLEYNVSALNTNSPTISNFRTPQPPLTRSIAGSAAIPPGTS